MKNFHRFITSIFVISFLCAMSFAQQSERTITKKNWDNEPLSVTTSKVKGTNVEMNQVFLNGNDWFNGLSVNIKNTTNKTMVFIDIAMNFPPSSTGKTTRDHLLYGQYPLPPGQTDNEPPIENQPPLQPNETATLVLDDYQGTRDYLTEAGQPQSINKIELEIFEVVFSDGTKWSGGIMLRRDPNNLNNWIPEQNINGATKVHKPLASIHLKNADFLYSSWMPTSASQQNQCRAFLLSEDLSCGVAACAVRRDFQGSVVPLFTPNSFTFEVLDDRCVDRRTHRRCSVFLETRIKKTACDLVFIPYECDREDCGGIVSNRHSPQFVKASFSKSAAFRALCPLCPSPIIVDVAGNGFDLTDATNGVNFDLNGDGQSGHKISWTTANSDDAWLVLDRNNNGIIDDGHELFGNLTSQPLVDNPHGFLALAEFDKSANGGNEDNVIDSRDSVFSRLRLWQDTNHNGFSEQSELHTVASLGLAKFELKWRESRRTDEYGNQFKYRAKVKDVHGAQVGRWAWDVFLVGER